MRTTITADEVATDESSAVFKAEAERLPPAGAYDLLLYCYAAGCRAEWRRCSHEQSYRAAKARARADGWRIWGPAGRETMVLCPAHTHLKRKRR